MAITSTTNKVTYTGNAVASVFPYAFKIFANTEIEVDKILISTQEVETLTLTTDYTVSGVGESTGGNVTLTAGALSALYKLTIKRVLPLTQLVDFIENDSAPAETFEQAYDRDTMIAQQLQETVDRCFKLKVYSTGITVSIPDPVGDEYLGWNTAGDALENKSLPDPSLLERASQEDAVAGTDNDDYMTPLRVKQSRVSPGAIGGTTPSTGAFTTLSATTLTATNLSGNTTLTGHLIGGDSTSNPTNILGNGNFESWSLGTTSVPDGWALEVTPTLLRDTGDVGYGSYSAKITAAGAGVEGISFTTGTLKASTSYSLSVRVKATAGDTASIITTGATTNISEESTSATFETKYATLVTDASGTAVVIKLMAKADGDIVWFDGAMLVEGSMPYAFSPKPAEEGVWADYGATSTIVGWSSYTTKQIYTKKIGKTVFVAFNIQGTSDSTATTFTLPYTNTAGISVYNTYMGQDTGGGYAPYSLYLAATGSTVVFNVAGLSATWTASGAKGIVGQFFYEIA